MRVDTQYDGEEKVFSRNFTKEEHERRSKPGQKKYTVRKFEEDDKGPLPSSWCEIILDTDDYDEAQAAMDKGGFDDKDVSRYFIAHNQESV